MRKTVLTVLFLVALNLLIACTSPPAEFADGYQFGDITRFTARELTNLEAAREAYCDQTSSSAIKRLAITAIQTQLPAYPPDGVCTQLMDVLLKPKDLDTTASTGTDADDQPIDAKARDSPK